MKFEVSVSPGSGHFEVIESGSLVASGRIYQPEEPHKVPGEDVVRPQGSEEEPQGEGEDMRLAKRDVYKELRLRGYDYGTSFQGIISAQNQGKEFYRSPIRWRGGVVV